MAEASNRKLSLACTDALDIWQRFSNLDPDVRLSEAVAQAMNDQYRRKRKQQIRDRVPLPFRRATETYLKLQPYVAVVLVALASFVFLAGSDMLAARQGGRLWHTYATDLLWRFLDAFDTRAWATWGTFLGIGYQFVQGMVGLPDENAVPNFGLGVRVMWVIFSVGLRYYLFPWLASWMVVYLAHGIFARRWHLEARWHLDEAFLDFRDALSSGIRRGIFWTSMFENVLYYSGYWALIEADDLQDILREFSE